MALACTRRLGGLDTGGQGGGGFCPSPCPPFHPPPVSSFWGARLGAESSKKCKGTAPLSCDDRLFKRSFRRKSPGRLPTYRSFRNLSRFGIGEDIERQVAFYCLGVAANRVFIQSAQNGSIALPNPLNRRVGFLQKVHSTVGVVPLPQRVPLWPTTGPARDFLFASIGALFAFLFAGFMSRIWRLEDDDVKVAALERGGAMMPELGVNLGQKESVEWVNMLIYKIWKVYRRSLEGWLVHLLQPAIDKLGKPDYVQRVEIAELNLDYEPISVRKVRRRASRRANDLQYQFGVRYTGGARCLLNLKLVKAGIAASVPVGVYDLDVDAELWVKLRLAPVKPYVGTLSIAFVRLPTIKLVLAPFKIVNLFAIPFLSSFLSKLLTVDLPRLLVLPRHITFDFLPHGQDPLTSTLMDLLKSEAVTEASTQTEPTEAFVGELSVTVCEARDLPIQGLVGWSNPYVTLALGDQVIESKRNKETSHPSGYRDPVWNQDFQFLVKDPRKQKLVLRVRDSSLTLNPNIGYCEVSLANLQDCVPRTHWVSLTREGTFGTRKVSGKLRLIFTFKSFVEEENSDPASPYIKVFNNDSMEELEQVGIHPSQKGLDMQPKAKTVPSPGLGWDGILSDDSDGSGSDSDVEFSPAKVLVSNEVTEDDGKREVAFSGAPGSEVRGNSTSGIVWIAVLTSVAYVFGTSLHLSNPLHPWIQP
ncbi:unnamed protein product [Calypogeia fissa]